MTEEHKNKIRAGTKRYRDGLKQQAAPEVQVIDPEVLPPATGVVVEQTEKGLVVRSDGSDGRPKGAFAPGHSAGLKRGSANKLTKAMRLAAIEEMERGGDRTNPLFVLMRVMNDPRADLRLQADCADRLAKHVWGIKNAFEIETPDAADEERISNTRRMFAVMFAEEVQPHVGQ